MSLLDEYKEFSANEGDTVEKPSLAEEFATFKTQDTSPALEGEIAPVSKGEMFARDIISGASSIFRGTDVQEDIASTPPEILTSPVEFVKRHPIETATTLALAFPQSRVMQAGGKLLTTATSALKLQKPSDIATKFFNMLNSERMSHFIASNTALFSAVKELDDTFADETGGIGSNVGAALAESTATPLISAGVPALGRVAVKTTQALGVDEMFSGLANILGNKFEPFKKELEKMFGSEESMNQAIMRIQDELATKQQLNPDMLGAARRQGLDKVLTVEELAYGAPSDVATYKMGGATLIRLPVETLAGSARVRGTAESSALIQRNLGVRKRLMDKVGLSKENIVKADVVKPDEYIKAYNKAKFVVGDEIVESKLFLNNMKDKVKIPAFELDTTFRNLLLAERHKIGDEAFIKAQKEFGNTLSKEGGVTLSSVENLMHNIEEHIKVKFKDKPKMVDGVMGRFRNAYERAKIKASGVAENARGSDRIVFADDLQGNDIAMVLETESKIKGLIATENAIKKGKLSEALRTGNWDSVSENFLKGGQERVSVEDINQVAKAMYDRGVDIYPAIRSRVTKNLLHRSNVLENGGLSLREWEKATAGAGEQELRKLLGNDVYQLFDDSAHITTSLTRPKTPQELKLEGAATEAGLVRNFKNILNSAGAKLRGKKLDQSVLENLTGEKALRNMKVLTTTDATDPAHRAAYRQLLISLGVKSVDDDFWYSGELVLMAAIQKAIEAEEEASAEGNK